MKNLTTTALRPFAVILAICGTMTTLTSCSDDDDKNY
jgi:hypothetical protein